MNMKKNFLKSFLILSFCVLPLSLFSQTNGVTHAGRNTGQPMFPSTKNYLILLP